MEDLAIELSNDHLKADMLPLIHKMDEGQVNPTWRVVDHHLYRGNFSVGGIDNQTIDSSFFDDLYELTQTTYLILYRCPDEGLDNCPYGRYMYVAGDYFYRDKLGKLINADLTDELLSKDDVAGYAEYRDKDGYFHMNLIYDQDNQPVGAIMVTKSLQLLSDKKRTITLATILIFIICFIVFGIIITISSTRWLQAIPAIKEYLAQAGAGQLPKNSIHFHMSSNLEFKDVKKNIDVIANTLRDKKRLDDELAFAHATQINMMPNTFPAFPEHKEFDVYAMMTPAKEVGGDFFDIFMPDSSHIAVVIADVSGKGVPAALFMVCTKALIKNYVLAGLSSAVAFEYTNKMLCDMNKAGLFVTAWMGILNIQNGKLDYVNAGHNPPLLSDENGQYSWLRSKSGFVLAGKSKMKYRPLETWLKPGARLFMYTDGVTEARNADRKFYGEERLLEYINKHHQVNIYDCLLNLKVDIDNFVGESEQYDDITMLLLEYKGSNNIDMITQNFEAKMEKLPEIKAFAKEILSNSACPSNLLLKILLVIEEIFVNISSYAYEEDSGNVTFRVSTENGMLKIVFEDSGIPFNPLEIKDAKTHGKASERSIGGLGIFMSKKIMDDIHYEYKDNKNILTLYKTIAS